jgi:hypothetical protein
MAVAAVMQIGGSGGGISQAGLATDMLATEGQARGFGVNELRCPQGIRISTAS